ncbi:MAG: phosphomethylpyrimidine synthase ThiC [Candidatus Altiarchaeota archaeon]|nr:phosphomethylpyrimidine synthase ThiC [Candidatus Altiarchaeota archaeon]
MVEKSDMESVAKVEGIDVERLARLVDLGRTVILKNSNRGITPVGVGGGLRVKVNANIGTSSAKADIDYELKKLNAAVEFGADTVMDLSTGGGIDKVRRALIKSSSIPLGTVPVYQAVVDAGDVLALDPEDFLKGIEKHVDDGVDFITVHCGLTKESIPLIKKRLMPVVSRGGSFLLKWMVHNKSENPLYTNFDQILDIAKERNVALSLGDALRPGCLRDATDDAQLHELRVLGELTKRARKEKVQVIVEGPGHVPLDQIEFNIKKEKELCDGAPFYVLGPLVTDVAPGYDHLTSAIGGALAAFHGADFLCAVSPKEHLGLPNIEDIKQAVISSKIAAHAADIAKGVSGARDWDDKMSEARRDLSWERMFNLALDPGTARKLRSECQPEDSSVCSMCGEFCSIKISKQALDNRS